MWENKKKDKNYEITLEQETAKEFGWEVMANFRRLEDSFEENMVLKKYIKRQKKNLKNCQIWILRKWKNLK